MTQTHTQIAVIGGGASGMTAAYTAARAGAQVTLLERLPRVGKKLLLTGNGRCNLGNIHRELNHYHGSLPQAAQILAQTDPEAFFRRLGVCCRTDPEGRIYPMSNTAASVLDGLRFACDDQGVQTCCDAQVTGMRQDKGGFLLTTPQGVLHAERVIFSAGGYAAPNCGTDGTAMALLRRLGHPVHTPQPALCPIQTDPAAVKALKGIRVHAAVSAILGSKCLRQETGELQFADGTLSGICVFQLSGLAAQYGCKLTVSVDLLPEWSREEAYSTLSELHTKRRKLSLEELLTGMLPKRLGQVLLRRITDAPLTEPASCLSPGQLQQTAQLLKALPFPVTGTAPWQAAQVTMGGIPGSALTDTLESRICPGLYITGEATDLYGDCGGYNLMWALASGICAGKAAAGSLHRKERNP